MFAISIFAGVLAATAAQPPIQSFRCIVIEADAHTSALNLTVEERGGGHSLRLTSPEREPIIPDGTYRLPDAPAEPNGNVVAYIRQGGHLRRLTVTHQSSLPKTSATILLHEYGANEGTFPAVLAVGVCNGSKQPKSNPSLRAKKAEPEPARLPVTGSVTNLKGFTAPTCAAISINGASAKFSLRAEPKSDDPRAYSVELVADPQPRWLPASGTFYIFGLDERGGVYSNLFDFKFGQEQGMGRLVITDAAKRLNFWIFGDNLIAICDARKA